MTPLSVVPVADVRAPEDRIQCMPYRAKICAGACLARQAAARPSALPLRNGEALRIDSRVSRADVGKCVGCADGVVVARALGAPVLVAPPPKPAPTPRPAVPKEEAMAPPAPTVALPASCTATSSRRTCICARCGMPGHLPKTCRRAAFIPVPEPVLQQLAARFTR